MAWDGSTFWHLGSIVGIVSFAASAAAPLATRADCNPPSSLEVVRVDERNDRMFVRVDRAVIEDRELVTAKIAEATGYIESCRKDWGRDWWVSFFSSAERAGYKDDPHLLPFVIDGTWQDDYLAEYQNAARLLVKYPLDPDKRNERTLEE